MDIFGCAEEPHHQGDTAHRGVDNLKVIPPGLQPSASRARERVEWTIRNMTAGTGEMQIRIGGLLVNGGRHLKSARFSLAGHDGRLLFYPNGYLSPSQRRNYSDLNENGNLVRSWCAIALVLPRGARLRFRLFVGDLVSDVRDCFWSGGFNIKQCWAPPTDAPPPFLASLTVGVEVVRDLDAVDAAPLHRKAWTPRLHSARGATPRGARPRGATPRGFGLRPLESSSLQQREGPANAQPALPKVAW